MLSLTHTIISLPVARYLENPWLIFMVALVLHLVADTLLHWNIYPWQLKRFTNLAIAADVGSGLAVAWLLLGQQVLTIPVLAAIAGGNMPDIATAFWDMVPARTRQKLRRLAPVFRWHDRLQLETPRLGAGLISQIILAALALWLLYL